MGRVATAALQAQNRPGPTRSANSRAGGTGKGGSRHPPQGVWRLWPLQREVQRGACRRARGQPSGHGLLAVGFFIGQ